MIKSLIEATGRMARIAAIFFGILLTLIGIGARPALADTPLCSGDSYSSCISAGYTDHGYGAHDSHQYWFMDAGHNCTNYVAFAESYVNSAPTPRYNLGNADTWASRAAANHVPVNQNPAIGSVAQWGDAPWNHNSGHVAYVEAVRVSNGSVASITVSEDAYPNGPFDWRVIAAGSNSWPAHFIHFKDLPTYRPPYVYYPVTSDFNGDGLSDIGLYDSGNGVFYLKHGPGFNDQVTYQWAAGNYQPFTGDFNGDGIADIGLRDPGTGAIYIKYGPGFGTQVVYQWAPGSNYQIITGDFNGDGIWDIGLYDSANGVFYIKHGPGFNDQITYQWAAGPNYQAFTGDFNADGIWDIGLRDASTGTFYIKHGPGFNDQITYPWAAGTNYQPITGDFNGDKIGDIGLRNADTGTFYIKHGPGFNDQVTYPWAAG